jgi:hypothetical protein
MNLNFFKSKKFLYIFFYITLLIGFFLSENTNQGSEYDFIIVNKVIKSFSEDLSGTFNNYNEFEISHFPFYYIFVSQIFRFTDSIAITKFIILHINLLLPYILFQILILKYNPTNRYLYFLPGILFVSPNFRSSSIWGLNDNIALIFFSLSILFYFKFLSEKKIKNKIIYAVLNAFTLALAAYTRQYYAVFSLFYLYKFLKKFDLRIIFFYTLASLIFASYAIKSTIFNTNLSYAHNFYTDNYSNNIIFSITIFIIYLLPILFNREILFKLFHYYLNNKIIFFSCTMFALLMCIFFEYSYFYGGGIIYKIIYPYSNYLYFFIFFSSLLVIIYYLSQDYKNNYFLFFCLLLAFPMQSIYQKYFDPLSIILIFSLFKNSYTQEFIDNLKFNLKYLYSYFIFIYISSLFYNFALR